MVGQNFPLFYEVGDIKGTGRRKKHCSFILNVAPVGLII